MYSEETPDDGQRNCPKHVEFYSKNKFEKLVRLVGFIIRIFHDVRSPERQFITMHGHLKVKTGYIIRQRFSQKDSIKIGRGGCFRTFCLGREQYLFIIKNLKK